MHEPPPCTEPAVFSSRRRKMMRATSHSEITSIAPSSASPAAAAAYYVQSPSRDSHDEIDKYSSSSPLESPSDPRHSMGSSSSTAGSRISGNRRRWNKHYCNVVAEDGGGAYGDDENEYENPWPSKCLMFVVAFGLCFAGICLVIWGASTHYKPQVTIKRLRVESLYFGEGSDRTGVPTRLITVNCSTNLVIYNPATFFGIHVASDAADLMFSQVTVATGQLEKYYQPRRSRKIMWVRLVGQAVPLYGAGAELTAGAFSGKGGGGIPFKLEFEIHSRGYLMGKLVKTKHKRHVSCSLLIDSKHTKEIVFDKKSCNYI